MVWEKLQRAYTTESGLLSSTYLGESLKLRLYLVLCIWVDFSQDLFLIIRMAGGGLVLWGGGGTPSILSLSLKLFFYLHLKQTINILARLFWGRVCNKRQFLKCSFYECQLTNRVSLGTSLWMIVEIKIFPSSVTLKSSLVLSKNLLSRAHHSGITL